MEKPHAFHFLLGLAFLSYTNYESLELMYADLKVGKNLTVYHEKADCLDAHIHVVFNVKLKNQKIQVRIIQKLLKKCAKNVVERRL